MKHLKLYETYMEEFSDYKKFPQPDEGDIVVCVDDEQAEILKCDDKYKILKKWKEDWNDISSSFLCKVRDLKSGKELAPVFFLDRFVKEIDYDVNKYNL